MPGTPRWSGPREVPVFDPDRREVSPIEALLMIALLIILLDRMER